MDAIQYAGQRFRLLQITAHDFDAAPDKMAGLLARRVAREGATRKPPPGQVPQGRPALVAGRPRDEDHLALVLVCRHVGFTALGIPTGQANAGTEDARGCSAQRRKAPLPTVAVR